jgi:hypothetical protein
VAYSGFTPAAEVAFQRAVDIWSTSVSSDVPITVNATFSALGQNVLGSAGPSHLWRDFAGAPRSNTWYPDAVANKHRGRQMDSTRPDIEAAFSSSFSDWWFRPGNAPADKIDFTAVVLHELGHGLGSFGLGNVTTAGRGSVRMNSVPMAYDRFTETSLGRRLLTLPDASTRLANELKSKRVYFDSTRVRAANRTRRARLFAPRTWQPGSSYSHLNEATYAPGTANSLMTPVIDFGETIRTPGPLTLAIFADIGW